MNIGIDRLAGRIPMHLRVPLKLAVDDLFAGSRTDLMVAWIGDRLQAEGYIPDEKNTEEVALLEARAAIETLGAEQFLVMLGNIRNKNYESKGVA